MGIENNKMYLNTVRTGYLKIKQNKFPIRHIKYRPTPEEEKYQICSWSALKLLLLEITPRNRVLPEKLIVAQMSRKIPVCGIYPPI
jgi:hypothetical protein